MNRFSSHGRILYICQAGVIAALYVVLTMLSAAPGLSSGAIQLRVSEALCILPFFLSAAVPGLTVGCLLANLLTGSLWQDILFGSLATLLGAATSRALKKAPLWVIPLPTVFFNTLIVPFILSYVYHAEGSLPYFFLTVGIGELLSAGVLGTLLALSLRPHATRLFPNLSIKKEYQAVQKINIPTPVLNAMDVLENAGFEVFVVGGCVRDSLLGRTPQDWDLTTNARPEELLSCFSSYRVIETGLKHGTLTVLSSGMSLEITTYRLDGAYADNRHPVQVTFSNTLAEDLSRRDFTVNALAYHPKKGLVDLFSGQADLENKKISCVGDPETRFNEDGLRILRAIRFASVLNFQLSPATAKAVLSCAPLLENIAKERIREEFVKLLCGVGAVSVLREFSDVIFRILPELAPMKDFDHNSRYHCFDVWEHTLHALSYAPKDHLVRLSLLFHDAGKPAVCTEDESGRHFKGHAAISKELADSAMLRLRFDNRTRETVVRLVELHDRPLIAEEKPIKRLLQKISEEDLRLLLEVKRCDRLAHAPKYSKLSPKLEKILDILDHIHASGACLSLATLAVNGSDLIAIGFRPGKEIGQVLRTLLDLVVDGSLPNDKEALLSKARELH